jgi:hypothetical protein
MASSWRGDDEIVTEVEGGDREGGVSMDVLLQVTLPIVLILAFLVVTEVQSLTDQIDRLQKDIEGTATGRLVEERDVALLELQEQLLYTATNEVGDNAEGELGLDRYAALTPPVDAILAGRVDADFAAASRAAHVALGDDQARRRTETRLREAVEERFLALVDEQTSLAGESRRRVLDITAENRESFELKLRGYVERFVDDTAAVQLDLMLRWLRDPEASERVEAESVGLWREIRAARETLTEAEAIDAFVDLKAAQLVAELEKQGVPLLGRTLEQSDL